MRYLFVLLLLIKFNFSFSQKVKKEEEIFTAVEKQAEYPGGMAAFGKFLQKNLKYNHPIQEIVYGKMYIKFIVEKDGHITDFLISPKEVNTNLDSTCLVKLKKIKWIPAMFAGKPVRSRFTIPINIYLSE
jgi:periplasmic protein TonB